MCTKKKHSSESACVAVVAGDGESANISPFIGLSGGETELWLWSEAGLSPQLFRQTRGSLFNENGVKMVTSFDQEANFGRKVCPQYMQDLLYHFFTPGFALIQK